MHQASQSSKQTGQHGHQITLSMLSQLIELKHASSIKSLETHEGIKAWIQKPYGGSCKCTLLSWLLASISSFKKVQLNTCIAFSPPPLLDLKTSGAGSLLL